jgi:hypothetical protein
MGCFFEEDTLQAPDIYSGYRCEDDGGALKHMMTEVETWCRAKGWADDGRTFGDECSLLHSEVSEALEAFRVHGFRRVVADPATFPYSEIVEVKEGEQYPKAKEWGSESQERTIPIKPEGVPSELADLLVRLLDTCSRHSIDLFAEWRAKMDYNAYRAYRHGNKAL